MKKILLVLGMSFLFVNSNFSQELNIDSYLKLVKKNNKQILLAAKDLEIADAKKTEARANAFPNVNSEAGYQRNLKDAFLFIEFPDPTTGIPMPQKFKTTYDNDFSLQTTLSQAIFNYTVFNAIKAAKQYNQLVKHQYDATIDGVLTGSKKAFYQTILLKNIWEVNKKAEKNALDNYNNILDKYNQGLVSKFALLQSEVSWKNLIPKTIESKRNFDLALNNIKLLTGLSQESNVKIIGELDEYPTVVLRYEIEEVYSNRPDLKAMQWSNQLLETNIEVERSGYFPSLYASLTHRFHSQANRFAFDNQNNYLIAGLSLKIPIFSGWGTDAKVDMAKIEVEKSNIQIEEAKDNIKMELKNLELKIKEAKNRIAAAETTLSTAKQAYTIAESSAKNGLATQLELKDARVGRDQATLNYYVAVYDYLAANFDWELALGIMEK